MQWTGTCRIKNRRHGSDYFHHIECRTLCAFSKLEKKLINDNNVLTVTLLVRATTTSCFFFLFTKNEYKKQAIGSSRPPDMSANMFLRCRHDGLVFI
jgi:hypothetical protein